MFRCPTLEVRAQGEVRIVQRKDLVITAEDDVAFEPLDLLCEALLERGAGGFGPVLAPESVPKDRDVVAVRHQGQV